MSRLDQFLNTAARQMRAMPAAARDDELRELRGHLEQRAEDYAHSGMADDAAQLRALEGLGSPRKLGASLCDAWEGIAFSWWRLAAAIAGVTALLLFGIAAFLLALLVVPRNSEIALLPEIVPLLCAFYIALPVFCGLLFSHWLGRRGCLVATLYFAALGFLALASGNPTVEFPMSSTSSVPALSTSFLVLVNAAWFPYFWMVLAFVGAWAGQRFRLQKRYQLALSGSNITPPLRVVWVPLNLKWWRNALLFLALVGALYAGRVWLQLHPQTPSATLKNYLLMPHSPDFAAPEILELRELPPASAAERAGRERRVHFRVAAHARPYFAASQIKYLQSQIESRKRAKWEAIPSTKAALERVKNNHQIVEGTVRLVETPKGWEVDDESHNFTRLWEWFYDR